MLNPIRPFRLARRILRTVWKVACYLLGRLPGPPDRGSTSSAKRSARRRGGW